MFSVTATLPRRADDLPRLKKRREFLRVARAGRKWATPGLVLQAWPRPDASPSARSTEAVSMPPNTNCGLASMARIGYTVSRKVGNAVNRNRAKRRLRAVAGQVMTKHARTGTDFVIIGRAATLSRPFEKLVADLQTALRKLNCYTD